jgi:hypothetical protein
MIFNSFLGIKYSNSFILFELNNIKKSSRLCHSILFIRQDNLETYEDYKKSIEQTENQLRT